MSGSTTTSICGGGYGCHIGGPCYGITGEVLFTVAFECCGTLCHDACTLGSTVPTLVGLYMILHVVAQMVATFLVKALAVILGFVFFVTGAAYWLKHLRRLGTVAQQELKRR